MIRKVGPGSVNGGGATPEGGVPKALKQEAGNVTQATEHALQAAKTYKQLEAGYSGRMKDHNVSKGFSKAPKIHP